ncbi:MAG: hypothetical protein KAU22_08310, partial [Desulfuromonadales bacterium]|nr:hypothetical protein [Desulfuromonadales bacterium]
AARDNDLGIKETGFFGSTDAIDGIGKVDAVSQAAFTLTAGKLARPIQTTQGVFLFTIKGEQPSHLPELTKVKTLVEQAYRTEQAQSLAKELADKLLTQATAQKSLRTAAKSLNLTVEESGDFSRNYGSFIPRIGTSQELADEAFVLTSESPIAAKVYTINKRHLVASLNNATIADMAALSDSDRNQLQSRLLGDKKEQLIQDKTNQLRQAATIEILVPELLAAFNKGNDKS